MHTPTLLFLDEPSTGLDPQNRVNLQEQIRAAATAEHGTTIVLTTHYLEEADAIADRVMVIDHGRVIADDTASRPQVRPRRPGDRSASRPSRRRDRGRQAVVILEAGAEVEREGIRRCGSGRRTAPTPRPGCVTELALAGRSGRPGWRSRAPRSTTSSCELTGRSLRESSETAHHTVSDTESDTESERAAA